jgi:hypothetical protein
LTKIRNRTYSFKIEVPLTDSTKGEARSFVSFVYDAPNKDAALNRWFLEHARTARHAGARGSAKNLLASLKVRRIAKYLVTRG